MAKVQVAVCLFVKIACRCVWVMTSTGKGLDTGSKVIGSDGAEEAWLVANVAVTRKGPVL